MFKAVFKSIIRIYHDFLGLFFDFDVDVYAYKTSKIKANKITDFQYKKPIACRELPIPKFISKQYEFLPPKIITYSVPSLFDSLVIKDASNEFYNSIKLKSENLAFFSVVKDYNLDLLNALNISSEFFELVAKSNKSLKKEIQISRKLQTIEEILELEPYVNEKSSEAISKIPVTKYPIRKEKFTELQIENMKTRLAIQANCKKYSMTLENIYDKLPKGLYSGLELNKDNSVSCAFAQNPDIGELQFLVTGKRRYDTHTTQTLISYSDLGIEN